MDQRGGQRDGRPLGMQPFNLRMRLLEHLRFADAASSFFHPTPSVTSESSSDLDTESTGSFLPERSTTLGSLIGVQSQYSTQSTANNETPFLRNGRNPGFLPSSMKKRRSTSVTASRQRASAWCPLGCATSADCQESFSPSLADFLEIERKASVSTSLPVTAITEADTDVPGVACRRSSFAHNTLFDDDGILPPQPSGAPLRQVTQRSQSPGSSYLSADWSTCDNVAVSEHHSCVDRVHGKGADVSRVPGLWSSICGRLSTSAACQANYT